MHFEKGEIPVDYIKYISRKNAFIIVAFLLLCFLAAISLSVGSVSYTLKDIFKTLLGVHVSKTLDAVIFNIRLPQVIAAIVAGAGLAVAGAVMQSVLGNPLASPFTLGIAQAAAFGAAFSVMVLGAGFMRSSTADAVAIVRPGLTTIVAFIASMVATGAVVLIAQVRRGSPDVMILAGVAIGSLCSAGTMFLQYFADDTQLASIVFWTFGDLARAGWKELGIMAAITFSCICFFVANAWNYNAIDSGEETAISLGVNVRLVRFMGMSLASLATAVIIAFVGVIGFVGLIGPHMARRLIGDDNRYLLLGSCIIGGILLLAADTAARTMLAPRVLPVAVLTSFVGAPVFLYLLVKGYRR